MQMPQSATSPRDLDALHFDVDPQHFKGALSQFATGVTVVTTIGLDGRPVGLTASSFNSVSLAPPLVLWSLSLRAASLPAFQLHTHYAVNVLAADQLALARRFASRDADRFAGVPFRLGRGGAPVLDGCVAWFECFNRSRHEEGDHVIFVGQVEACGYAAGQPLLFHGGQLLDDAPLGVTPPAGTPLP